jgi:Tfp pilus assembly protein PilN
MPCLQEKDLSELASAHVAAQKANIKNQRSRLDQIKSEYESLKSNPNTDSLKLKEVESAIADLDYHLNGRVARSQLEEESEALTRSGLNADRLNKLKQTLANSKDDILKDPDLKTAEERSQVMEALYKQRAQFQFEDTAHDKDKDGNSIPRYASVFGAPTVKRMIDQGEREIAEDLMLRSVSLVSGGDTTKNPSDYLDATGIEVKKSLSDGIEHHHIYNNVYVDQEGRVAPNSVRFHQNSKTGDIEMEVIPEYWNSAKHGRNTQFIELMDGAHSGDDTATHLHYYKFNDKESEFIRQKIKDKVAETVSTANARLPKLSGELDELKERKENPEQYKQRLSNEVQGFDDEIALLDAVETKYTTADSRGARRKNKGLTEDEEKELNVVRDKKKAIAKAKDKVQKSLSEHQEFMDAESNIKHWSQQASELEAKAKAIKLNVKFPTDEYPDKDSAKAAKLIYENQARELRQKAKNSQRLLRDKGSLDQQIRDKQFKLNEAQKLANLSESEALAIYERTNGYFSFDKGHQESQDYSKSRPRMNAEIHKHNVRETIEVLESEGKDITESLQEIARKNYKRNLLYNLEPLVNKAAGTLK